MRGRPWTPFENSLVRCLTSQGWAAARIAQQLHRTEGAISAQRSVLGLTHPPSRPWTTKDIETLRRDVDQLRKIPQLARSYRRTETAVRRQIRKLRLTPPPGRYLTRTEIARRLGVSWDAVDRWMSTGALLCRHRTSTVRDLEDFVENERYWTSIDLERIRDPHLQQLARNVRQGRTFLTTKEVATILGTHPDTVVENIHRLRLRAARGRGMIYLIRSDWLENARGRLCQTAST